MTKGKIENEDTQRRNFEHRRRGIIVASKVSAAITTATISAKCMVLLQPSWFSGLSRLSICDNRIQEREFWVAGITVVETRKFVDNSRQVG